MQTSCCVMMLHTSRLFVTAFSFISLEVHSFYCCSCWIFINPSLTIPLLRSHQKACCLWPSKGANKMGITIFKHPESPRVCIQTSVHKLCLLGRTLTTALVLSILQDLVHRKFILGIPQSFRLAESSVWSLKRLWQVNSILYSPRYGRTHQTNGNLKHKSITETQSMMSIFFNKMLSLS